MRQTRRYKIQGKVQDVYFRDFTQEQADVLNIVGWVRNCNDGTVESIATALPTDLDVFVEKLSQGPELASVTNVGVEDLPLQEFSDFIITKSI